MTRSTRSLIVAALPALALLVTSACSGGSGSTSMMPAANNGSTMASRLSPVDTDTLAGDTFADDGGGRSILRQNTSIDVVGSTVDPVTGDLNPYGLDVAKTTSGLIAAGDLVVCNFNDSANVQGTGTSIVALHPQLGSTPTHIVNSASLLGCDALAMNPNGFIWTADFAANNNPITNGSGMILTTLPQFAWTKPFGEAFAPRGPAGGAFYVSNAGDGRIVRVNLSNPFTFDVIASGFAVNGGVPGSILAPSGLNYDAKHDRLYIVDGTNNTVVALRHVSTIPNGGVVVNPNGTTFSGPFHKRARLVFSGAPLNGPISSALLPNGNLVVGNTLDATGFNIMVEMSPNGRLIATRNVDNGAGGSIFGMVATGRDSNLRDVKLYFNDDNANALWVIER